MQRGYQDRAIYGVPSQRNVTDLILDPETKIPWQVPEVVVQFESIDYVSEEQEYTVQARKDEGMPVSPTRVPGLEEMSRDEYECAVEGGDSRVAVEGAHLFEFCRDSDIGWLDYGDR